MKMLISNWCKLHPADLKIFSFFFSPDKEKKLLFRLLHNVQLVEIAIIFEKDIKVEKCYLNGVVKEKLREIFSGNKRLPSKAKRFLLLVIRNTKNFNQLFTQKCLV